jgi:hypothetical protein
MRMVAASNTWQMQCHSTEHDEISVRMEVMMGFLLICRRTAFGMQGILNSELARKWEMCKSILKIYSFNKLESRKINLLAPESYI